MASAVQSANSTSATSCGSIQCTPLLETPFGNGAVGVARASDSNRLRNSISCDELNPVPTRPA